MFHYLVPLMNTMENGNGAMARLTGLTQYIGGGSTEIRTTKPPNNYFYTGNNHLNAL
jgi:hypothetical protein